MKRAVGIVANTMAIVFTNRGVTMNLYSKVTISAIALGTAIFVSSPARAQQMITIYIDGRHILSTDTYTFEIYDRECNVSRGTVTVPGGESNARAVSVCAGGTGKGSITYRNVSLNGPTVGSHFLSNGEHVHP